MSSSINLESVAHLLPRTVRQLVDLIGLPLTLLLIEQRGGTTIPIGKCIRRGGHAQYEELAEIIGYQATNHIYDKFSGDMLTIPLCISALREARDRLIRAEFDQLTKKHTAMHTVYLLARKNRMTERNVWYILKRVDCLIDKYERQSSLF